MNARTLYFTEPGRIDLHDEPLEPPTGDDLLIETAASGISAGSELLVYRGEFPDSVPVDETIDALDGGFEYPLAYGYSAVGEVVETGPESEQWVGRRVFCFAPHATHIRSSPEAVVALPDDIDTEAATLLPTVETATNLVLDGHPRLGERVVVFGAGPVGLCTTHALAGFPLEELVVVEPIQSRRETARALGADRAISPEDDAPFASADPGGADLVYELSGRPETLDDAIAAAGYDSRVVVGSWYGSKRADVDLGGSFHRNRIDLLSSQVSSLAPELRGRWDKPRRFDVAFDRLRQLDSDVLATHRVPFGNAGDAYDLLDTNPAEALHVILTYP
ncbi:MAG: zinc-binding alcohol dehydrogenase [Halolamina sp.]|uniref:zinc-dependent alcohol dehydrogenase n=1 Tax=Halolamina sp. TaxID=1940283 RepID=UPI002FC39402